MNKCYLDSNILVYLKDSDSAFHTQSTKKLQFLVEKDFALVISPLVIDEFLYVFRYGLLKQKNPHPFVQLRKALRDILDLPNVCIVSTPIEHPYQVEIIHYMEKYGLDPRDAYHLLTMKKNSVDYFLTFDNDFNRIFKAKVLKLV